MHYLVLVSVITALVSPGQIVSSATPQPAQQRATQALARRVPYFTVSVLEAFGSQINSEQKNLLTTTGFYGGVGLPVSRHCDVNIQSGISIIAGSSLPAIRFATGFGCSTQPWLSLGLSVFIQDSGIRQSVGFSTPVSFKMLSTPLSIALIPNITCSVSGCTYFGAVGVKVNLR